MKTKTKQLISYNTILKLYCAVLATLITQNMLFGGSVYVNSKRGNDTNSGTIDAPFNSIHKAMELVQSADNDFDTIKINPGIYALTTYVDVNTKKDLTDRRIVIEASLLPGNISWKPESMPVLISIGPKGEIPDVNASFVSCFLINSDKVTFRGLKFAGYPLCPNVRSFGIARVNNINTDLAVEQCMFVGEENAAHLQAGVIANGNKVKIDHCIFFKARNAIVYLNAAAGQTTISGNSFTNNIVYGVDQAAIWTCTPGNNFVFKNNIVANSKYVWMLLYNTNTTAYTAENCVFANNTYMEGINRQPGDFNLTLMDVTTEGDIELILVDAVDNPLPKRFMHVKSGTLGSDLDAGLFMPETKVVLMPGKAIQNEVQIYPNPAESLVKVISGNSTNKAVNCQVFDSSGAIALERELHNDCFDISSLSTGMFIIRIEMENGLSYSKSLIIN